METLSYKPNAGAVVERLCRLYARQAQDEVFASFEIPNPALDRFAAQHPTPFCDYPDPHERVRFCRTHSPCTPHLRTTQFPAPT
jgi:hypothetical protein